MAQSGIFRKSMSGFNKQDVLQFIDEITAEWNKERLALEQTANEAVAARDELLASTDEAIAAAAVAVEQQQKAEAQLSEAQVQLQNTAGDLSVAATTIEEMATQLEEAQRRLAQLEQELAATANERDNAIAALADAKAQLTATTGTAEQLEESRRQVSRQNEQIASMRATIDRYENIVGDVDAVHEKMESIVRPYIDQTARQADEALNNVQSTLTALLAQLGDLQTGIDQSRRQLLNNTTNNDARLTAALDEWLNAAQGISGNHHFFP